MICPLDLPNIAPMRLDEDYLRELELWPMFALQQRVMAKHDRKDHDHQEQQGQLAPNTETPPEARLKPSSQAYVSASNNTPNPMPGIIPAAAIKPAASGVSTRPTSAMTSMSKPIDPERAARIAGLDWAGLAAEAANCQACNLCKQRKQAVLGTGAKNAPWFFIGEGPGADEDQQGEPFVGQAGKLLDAMLTAAGLQRGREVYIANVVKCRPPGNRTPSVEEAAACAPLLDRQIELIQPKLLVALGKTAASRLTQSEASMASLRRQLHTYTLQGRPIPLVATYHPAYLLRNPADKLKVWEDLLRAKKTMQNIMHASTT